MLDDTKPDPKGFPKPFGSTDASLCLACGLCCDGVLHAHAVVKPDEIERVRALGLTVERIGDTHGFRQPCPLYREQRCSVYPNHPATCRAYRCDLLKKHLAGAITREQGAQIIHRARALHADVIAQLPPGYAFEQLRRELDEEWDSGRGVFGSAEMRQQHAAFLLTVTKLAMYARRQFGKEGKRKVARQ